MSEGTTPPTSPSFEVRYTVQPIGSGWFAVTELWLNGEMVEQDVWNSKAWPTQELAFEFAKTLAETQVARMDVIISKKLEALITPKGHIYV